MVNYGEYNWATIWSWFQVLNLESTPDSKFDFSLGLNMQFKDTWMQVKEAMIRLGEKN